MGILAKTLASALKSVYSPVVRKISLDLNSQIRELNDNLKKLNDTEKELNQLQSDFQKWNEERKLRYAKEIEKRTKARELFLNEFEELSEKLKLSVEKEMNKINNRSGEFTTTDEQKNKLNYLLAKHPKHL